MDVFGFAEGETGCTDWGWGLVRDGERGGGKGDGMGGD